jgi:AcrR family transcriptional regulator
VARESSGRYHHGDLRNALIEAALQLVAEKGVAGLTLRETARRVGVSQAAPYRHFPDKSALLAAVAEEGFRSMHQQILEALAQSAADTASRLSAIGVGYVRFAVDHPAHFRIMFAQELTKTVTSPTAEQAAMAVFQELAAEILKGQLSGFIRADDPIRLAVACWAIAHGLAAILVEGLLDRRLLGAASTLDPETLTRLVTQLLVVGLAAQPAFQGGSMPDKSSAQ